MNNKIHQREPNAVIDFRDQKCAWNRDSTFYSETTENSIEDLSLGSRNKISWTKT